MPAKYVIGIDLGTTNSVLCSTPVDADRPRLELLPIPQLVATATVESRTMLPSFLYLAAGHEAARRGARSAVGRGPGLRHRRVRPAAGRRDARPHRGGGQVVVVPQPRGPPSADPAVERPGRSAKSLAGGGLATLHRAPGGRVGVGTPGRPHGRATRRAHGAGLVRRQRPRTDARGGVGRGAAVGPCLVGRAAGGGLRLAGHHRRALAAACFRWAIRCWSATSAAARPT